MSLAEVLAATGGTLISGPTTARFAHLYTDSREVEAGGLFVALQGEQLDGHAFIDQAVERGAAGILCQRPPVTAGGAAVVQVADTRQALRRLTASRLAAHSIPVVAITGSAGKTTAKDLAAHVLSRRLVVRKSEGNLNTYTGIPITVFELAAADRVLVVEYAMSSAGEIRELAQMAPPTVGVVLNVGLAHVGLLGSIESVAEAKQELVDGLAAGGLAVLNADDPRVRKMAGRAPRHVLYGLALDAAVRADRVRLHGLAGSQFRLITPLGETDVFLRLPGRHSVSNALAVAAVALEFGFAPSAIASALHGFLPPPHRMNVLTGKRGATLIDDCYNASPGSMAAALEVLHLAPRGSDRIAVLGDMLELGGQSDAAHDALGRRAAQQADRVIAVGAQAERVAAAARAAGLPAERADAVDSLESAARRALDLLGPRAVVLVKGSRGMKMEAIVSALAEPQPG